MTFKEKYTAKKEKLFSNKKICKYNKNLFKRFFNWEEIKLKRRNDLRENDENYCNFDLKDKIQKSSI